MVIPIQEQCGKSTATNTLKSVGFEALGISWPSCYYHKRLSLFLVIYVDDFKMAGPEKSIKDGWSLLRKGLGIEAEARVGPQGYSILVAHIFRNL